MRADLIHVAFEDYGHSVLITLRGTFTAEQIPALREKLTSFTEERKRTFLIDLNHCQFRDASYLELFLDLLNQVQGRDSRLAFIFSNEENWQFFRRWSNVFEIHANLGDFSRSGLLDRLRRRGIFLSKRTGVRLSPSMAFILGILIFGWILTLLSVVRYQESEIRAREHSIALQEEKQRALLRDLQELRFAIGPLRDLGLLESSREVPKDSLQVWVDYLDRMEAQRKKDKERDSALAESATQEEAAP